MNDIKIGTYNMQDFGLYLPEYVIPAPAPQTKFVDIIGRDGPVDLSNALGDIHYGARKWTLNFKCFDPTVNWHTLTSNVMKAIHGKRLNFEFADDPNYFWTGRFSVVSYTPKNGEGTIRVDITSDPFKYTKLATIVQETVPKTITYSGSVASFTATADNGITSLTAAITPVQSFNGYDRPWAAGAGKSKVPVSMTSNNYTDYGIDITVNDDGTITTTGSNTGTATFSLTSNPIFSASNIADELVDGQTYFLSGCPVGGSSSTYRITLRKTTNGTSTYVSDSGSGALFTYDAASTYLVYININKTVDVDGFVWKPMICLDSESDKAWEPYANVCPITGWTGANIYVSPTQDQADATTYTSDWTSAAGTVYAGSYDAVSGKLKERPQYASYNGETLVGPWLSSMDVYAAGATPTTGAQVVDLGGAETEYTLTPQTVSVLVGQNYVWSDTGDVSVDLSAPILLTNNGSKPVVPTITASAQMTLMWDNYTYTMNAGTAVVPQLVLNQGTTKVFVDGTGTIKFEYSEASL